MTTFAPEHAAVWFEIPVGDLARAKAFYGAVLGAPLKDEMMGDNPTAIFPAAGKDSIAGHLYAGKPAAAGTGNTIHLRSPEPLEAALERVRDNGGTVASPIIAIPAGRFAYCRDPDGNSIGLFGR